MTHPAARRLVIDARNRSSAAARQLLGLSLLRRMIRAARRSGFDDIVVLAGADEIDRLRPLIVDESAVTIVPAVPTAQKGTVTARVPADLVGERSWLEQLATETANNGARRTDGADILLFNADATPEQIASTDTVSAGEPIVFRNPAAANGRRGRSQARRAAPAQRAHQGQRRVHVAPFRAPDIDHRLAATRAARCHAQSDDDRLRIDRPRGGAVFPLSGAGYASHRRIVVRHPFGARRLRRRIGAPDLS